MSTRSRIAIKQKDGTYKSIYCHSDGYLEHNGYILYNNYQDPTKIKLLIDLGDLSYLGKYVYPDTTKEHNFSNRQDNVTVAYHRDRNEDLNYLVSKTKDELIESVSKSDQEFLYIYEDGKWSYAKTNTKDPAQIEMEDLESELLNRNIISNVKTQNNTLEKEIATELVQYAKNFDSYEYNDIYDNDDKAFEDMESSLSKEKIDSTMEWLSKDIYYIASEKGLNDPEMQKLSQNAFNLLCKISYYKSTFEKDKEMEI